MIEMNSPESLCRICLRVGANIHIFKDSKSEDGSNSTIQKKLSFCLSEKFEDVPGYPQYICHFCQVTLNTVYDFINKYKETCKVLQNSLQAVVKQEIVAYEDYDDFVYLEENTIETLELKPITKIKIEFEDAPHFIEKIKPLCKLKNYGNRKSKKEIKNGTHFIEKIKPSKLKIDRKRKKEFEEGAHFIRKIKPLCELKTGGKSNSKQVDTVKKKAVKKLQIHTLSRNKRNVITASLLEGEFVWTGEDWCTASPQNIDSKKPPEEKKEYSVQLPLPPQPAKKSESVLCESCGETFKSRDYLKTHVEIRHNIQTVACSICKAKFATQHSLKRHIKRIHGPKNFICSTCGKGFAYETHLSKHVKVVHEKLTIVNKNQQCKFCDRKYFDKKSLSIHERSVHTGERPAQCTECDASFFHKDYLKEHMRLHTGERPFECPVCGRGYAQRGNMKSHMRNHRISELSKETLSKIKSSWYKFMKP